MDFRRRDLLIATGVALLLPRAALALPVMPSRPRRLDLKNANTGESFGGLYRDKTGPIPSAIADLAHFLRDHHANKQGPVSVATLDFLADVMDAVGESKATILSAYRTKATNEMLRSRYFGVAEKSQHLLGKALDITFGGNIGKAERAALAMKRGGVGWYPNSHFIHLDSGPVRQWQIDYTGVDHELLGPLRPHHIQTYKEMLARSRAQAWQEFLLRQRGKRSILTELDP